MSNVTFKMSLKNVSQTPRKVASVAALLRNRSLSDALVILEHTPRRSANEIAKLLKNSQATAKNNYKLLPDSLRLNEIFVTDGPRLKRWKVLHKVHRAQRRQPFPRVKRSCHVFAIIEGQSRSSAAKKATPKPTGGDNGTKS